MINGKKIIVVMPAYNTAKTLEMAVNALPRDFIDEVILVDDGSKDNTYEIAQRLGLKTFRHEKNRGYGAAQKTLYTEALKASGDIIVMVHSDFQYDPSLVPEIIKPIVEGKADVCFGSRMHNKKSALKGGMPLWRFIPNMGLTFVQEIILRLHLTEYHSGYRAYSRFVLERIPFEKNSNNYVFDSEMLAQLAAGRFRAAEIPIPTRYFKEAQSPSFSKSVRYGFTTLNVLMQYLLHISHLKQYDKFVIKK